MGGLGFGCNAAGTKGAHASADGGNGGDAGVTCSASRYKLGAVGGDWKTEVLQVFRVARETGRGRRFPGSLDSVIRGAGRVLSTEAVGMTTA